MAKVRSKVTRDDTVPPSPPSPPYRAGSPTHEEMEDLAARLRGRIATAEQDHEQTRKDAQQFSSAVQKENETRRVETHTLNNRLQGVESLLGEIRTQMQAISAQQTQVQDQVQQQQNLAPMMSRIVRPKEFLEATAWPALLRCTDLLSLQSALTQFFGEVLFGQSVHSKREAEKFGQPDVAPGRADEEGL